MGAGSSKPSLLLAGAVGLGVGAALLLVSRGRASKPLLEDDGAAREANEAAKKATEGAAVKKACDEKAVEDRAAAKAAEERAAEAKAKKAAEEAAAAEAAKAAEAKKAQAAQEAAKRKEEEAAIEAASRKKAEEARKEAEAKVKAAEKEALAAASAAAKAAEAEAKTAETEIVDAAAATEKADETEKKPESTGGSPPRGKAINNATGAMWKVVGGGDKGGIMVREGAELSSPELARLSTGAIIEERERRSDGRLRYRLIKGDGPSSGWISVMVKGKPIIIKISG